MLRKVVLGRQKALFVVPFVAVAAEKVAQFSFLFGNTVKVIGLYGGTGLNSEFDEADVAVCTIEKANGLMNHLIENEHEVLQNIGVVVIDEVHMISDEKRGYLIEMLLTKLRYALGSNVQIVAMSGNTDELRPISCLS